MARRRRRDAWASIAEIRAGEVYRIRYWAEGPDGYRRRSRTVRGTRRDAERARAELMLAHGDDAPCPTVGEAWARWALPAYERRVEAGDMAAQSLAQFRSSWARHVAPRWADVPCDAVRPLAVQQWLDGMGRGPATRALEVLRPTLDYAVRYGCVQTNPFRERYVMPSRATMEAHDKAVWTLDELGGLWRDAALGAWWEAAFLLSAFAGLRVGEALAVRADDLGAVERDGLRAVTVTVARQMPNHGKVASDRLKTPQSARTVCVPGRAGARLESIAAASLSDGRDGWLSGDGLGSPNNQVRFNRAWARALSDAGLERHPLRNLRNSFQTNARWVLGVPPWILEPIMGHVGGGVTGQYYDRPSGDMLALAIAEAHAARPYDSGWDWARWDD